MPHRGFVKIHRALREHPIWRERPFGTGQAWTDLLLRANHAARKVKMGSTNVEVNPGELLFSEEKLSMQWGWSRGRVRRFLDYLVHEEGSAKVDRKKGRKWSRLTLLNWYRWQDKSSSAELTTSDNVHTGDGTTSGRHAVQQADIRRTGDGHKQECKKGKNDEKGKEQPDGFERWWGEYENKAGKAKALSYWLGKRPLADGEKRNLEPYADKIIGNLARIKSEREAARASGEFVANWKNADSWLYNKSWHDEIAVSGNGAPRAKRTNVNQSALQEWARMQEGNDGRIEGTDGPSGGAALRDVPPGGQPVDDRGLLPSPSDSDA